MSSLSNDDIDLLVDRLVDVVGERVRLLLREELAGLRADLDQLLPPVAVEIAEPKICAKCRWSGATTSTHCRCGWPLKPEHRHPRRPGRP